MTSNDRSFVTVWRDSHSLNEVASRLGIKPQSASARATRYRKRGVFLKIMDGFGRGRKKIDADELNEMVSP